MLTQSTVMKEKELEIVKLQRENKKLQKAITEEKENHQIQVKAIKERITKQSTQNKLMRQKEQLDTDRIQELEAAKSQLQKQLNSTVFEMYKNKSAKAESIHQHLLPDQDKRARSTARPQNSRSTVPEKSQHT